MNGSWSRVVLLGGGGAGKSTVARALADRCDLPVVHLDQLYWQPGWVEPDPPAWSRTVSSLAAAPRWLMDGNYASTLAPRLARADLVVLLDLPRRVTIPRVLRRAWRHRHGTRPDMAPGCPEKVNLAFLQWIWNFRRQSLPGILAAVDAAPHRPRLVRLRSARQVRDWLADL